MPVSLALAVAALLSGIGLLAGGRRRRWGATGAIVVCGVPALFEVVALLRHLAVPNVGTFGIYLNDRLSWPLFARDLFLFAMAVVLRRLQNRRASDHRAAASPVRWAARR